MQGDNILLLPHDVKLKSDIIIIPDSIKKDLPVKATVISVPRDEATVKVGDVVFFAKFAGNDIELSGKQHKIVKRDAILAFVKS